MSLGSNSNFTSSSLWSEALATPGPKGKVKIRKSDQIKYPQFIAGSELVTDEYWKELLIKCAKGKFPRGFSFSDDYLLHRASGVSIQIPENPSSLVEAMILFLRSKGNIYSPDDLAFLETVAHQHLIDGEDEETAWARIYKGKNTRAKYIRDYVDRVYCHLPENIRNELFTQINTCLELGSIKKIDINFQKGQINYIDGVTASLDGVQITKTVSGRTKASKPAEERKPSQYQHYENWVAYMQKFVKYIVDSQSTTVTIPSLSNSDT